MSIWNGSTVSYDGYDTGLTDGKANSFIVRADLITTPELIIVFGATNDAWAASDTGSTDFLGDYLYKPYADYTDDELSYFRPALACLFDKLQHKNIGSKIVFVLNQRMDSIKESVTTVCQHYNVPMMQVSDVALGHAHPTEAAWKQ